jgi:steroid 5-alpha reductase family enzyme
MTALWLWQRAHRDAGIVDVGWAALLGVLALGYAVVAPGPTPRTWLVALLAALWAFRLAIYLLRDRILGKPEDGRYQKLRRDLGARFQPWIFGFYQFQGLADVLLSVPMLIAMRNAAPFPLWSDFAGAAVLLAAITGESVADAQLARFRADPANRGRTCRVGLWGWSRHPNYFFEWLHWWAYVLFAIGAPFGWATLFAPAVMFYLLFRVTGIPATEARALETRGEDYRDYQRTTSVFVPLPPRRRG